MVGVVLRLGCVLTCKRTFQFTARHAPRFTRTCTQGLRTQKAEASTVIALPPNHYKYPCLTDSIFKHDPTGSGNSRATQPDWVRNIEDIWIWLVKSNLRVIMGWFNTRAACEHIISSVYFNMYTTNLTRTHLTTILGHTFTSDTPLGSILPNEAIRCGMKSPTISS